MRNFEIVEAFPEPFTRKPQRAAAALQDASEGHVLPGFRQVLDCASPLALWLPLQKWVHDTYARPMLDAEAFHEADVHENRFGVRRQAERDAAFAWPVTRILIITFLLVIFGHTLISRGITAEAGPSALLDERFELPSGFHIYRAAGPELTGGSYAMTFDGEGRLLVGDGNAVRRLIDRDNDGVFDSFEVIATGLGWRGPQGLLVHGDRLFAVGGDGIQLFEGYRSGGTLVHRGRIGNKLGTGGDHDAHTIFRGHDGYLYFMAGNGAGIEDRRHITEASSPVLFEREASVFRISPDGQKWECIAAGGRNPPNLGMNYLGDLFSFDSDMEWHVSVPWYRPVRLNHWAIGGDQGWQEVGAYPPYYIDCLPGILDIGRGSPTWGTFYEHTQFPEKFRDAYLVCDYRWKRESNDQYATTGRLVAFFLKREGGGWKASMEDLARPKPGARDSAGTLINFALVDVEVAPDGSLFVTDHNQGIWRIFYHAANAAALTRLPEIVPQFKPLPTDSAELFHELIALPQPGSERSRLREEAIRAALGKQADTQLQQVALDSALSAKERLRALRLLAPGFASLPLEFINHLSADGTAEIRAQAAWLLGIRGQRETSPLVIKLLNDAEPFVRRRAAEAFTRLPWPEATDALIGRLSDPVRLVRYVAMVALAHRPVSEWFDKAVAQSNPQIQMRALVASLIRREAPSDKAAGGVVTSLLDTAITSENRLDLLRVLGLFQKSLVSDPALKQRIFQHLLKNFPDSDRDLRWEQIRLLGEYRCAQAFPKLLSQLESERDEVTQFHIAQAIARLAEGWNADEEARLVRWFLGTQRGWFTEFAGKGVEFPDFWATVLADFGKHHREALLRRVPSIDFASQLGGVIVNLMTEGAKSEESLTALYRNNEKPDAKLKIVRALKKVQSPTLSAFLRAEYQQTSDPNFRGALLQSLAAQPVEAANRSLITDGLRHVDPDVVRACADALPRFKPDLDEDLANLLLSRLGERRDLFHPVQKVLVVLGKTQPPGFTPEIDSNRRPDDATRRTGVDFWKNWYEQRFRKKFEPRFSAAVAEKSDEEIHKFILSEDARGGNAVRGAKVYELVQCNTCHGGGVTPGREGRIFGPDLAGVTRRLSRSDLADAIVYPSKQVPDRFKGYEVELKDSTPLTGFITEQNDESVTLADREQVHRIPKSRIRAVLPQATSLMPERLLNRLSEDEIRDLLAFLEEGAALKEAAEKKQK